MALENKTTKAWYFTHKPNTMLDCTEQLDPATELAFRRIWDFILKTNDRLIDNDATLARIAKLGIRKWKDVKRVLLEMPDGFYVDSGFIRNHEASEAVASAIQNMKQQSEAGKASAAAKKNAKNNRNPIKYNAISVTGVEAGDVTCVETPVVTDAETTQHPISNIQSYTNSRNPSKPDGVFNNGFDGNSYSIISNLSEDGLKDAKQSAPGWDIYRLASTYDEKINSGERDPPAFPDRAFPKWCEKYTKGISLN